MKSKKVLIAEDNRDGAETLRHLIEVWGHEVEVSYDGSAAVMRARAFKPAVVILDVSAVSGPSGWTRPT